MRNETTTTDGVVAAARASRLAADSPQGLALGEGPAIASMRLDQPPGSGVPPQVQRPVPVEAGLTVLAVASLLIVAAIWHERDRLRLGLRQTRVSTLLPKPRWGATSHEQLHDARYLGRILEKELSGSTNPEDPGPDQPARPADSSGDDETGSPRRPEHG
jgi:hypothetical protein